MMVNVDFGSLRRVGDRPKGLVITPAVNWLIKPFTMAALGVLFFEHVFAGLIHPADAQQYLAGVILLGAAPCTAMVFVWSQLTRGEARGLIETWREDYNWVRPHGGLGGRTPEEFARYSACAKDRAEGAALLEGSAPSARSTTAPNRGKRRTDPSYPR